MIQLKTNLEIWRKNLLKKYFKAMPSKHFDLAALRLENVISGIFGYYALLYGESAKKLVANELIVRNSIVVSEKRGEGDLCCRYEELSVASDCIDLAVLPEVLQHSEFPHQILREVERVLIPEGYVILLIENPLSWFSVRNRIIAFISNHNTNQTRFRKLRINDWFRLLGFEITEEVALCSYNLPSQPKKRTKILSSLYRRTCEYFASHYVIVAKKKVSTLTPIRPSWRSNSKLVNPRLTEPSVTSRVDDCIRQIVR